MIRRRSSRIALGAVLAATLLATNLSAGAGVAQATATGTTWTPPGDPLTTEPSTNVSADRTVVREGESVTITISGVPTRLCAAWVNGFLLNFDQLDRFEASGTIPWSGLMSSADTVDKVVVIRCYAVDFVAGVSPTLDDPFESGVTITFEASVAAPVWTTEPTLPNATAGSAYSQVLTATGSPAPTYAFAEGELPAGLVFDADTNTVSGTTTTAGTFTFTVTASNSEGSVNRTFSLTIDRSTNLSTDRTVVREGESVTLTLSGVPSRLCAGWVNGVLDGFRPLAGLDGATIPWSGLMSRDDTVDKVVVIRCYAVDFEAEANPTLDDPFESGVTITFKASVSYSAQGYFAPVDRGVHNTVKGGNSVPLKFRVFDRSTEITDPALLTFKVTQIPCANERVDPIEQVVSGATVLRYDPVARQFIQTWRTPKQPGKCYSVSHWIGGTQLVSAQFKLR